MTVLSKRTIRVYSKILEELSFLIPFLILQEKINLRISEYETGKGMKFGMLDFLSD